MKSTKILSLLLVVIMCFTILASCGNKNKGNENIGGGDTPAPGPGPDVPNPPVDDDDPPAPPVVDLGGVFEAPAREADATLPTPKLGDYTYNSAATALGSNWNPHTWENSSESSMLGYITSPFVTIEARDTVEGLYQWVGEMATAIKDVTADHTDLLTKYNVNLPKGVSAPDVKKGYVFEFTLNPKAAWEDGTPINADSYIYSMQQLLDPGMKNYRANLYISGESAIAGGLGYYYNNEYAPVDAAGKYALADMTKNSDGTYSVTETGDPVYVALKSGLAWLGGYSLEFYVNYYSGAGIFDEEAFAGLAAIADEDGYVALTDDSLALLQQVISLPDWGEDPSVDYVNYLYTIHYYPESTFDTVGLIKTGDYSFIYVCDTAIDFNYFLTSCTDTWLVHEGLYEAGKTTADGITVTNYCSSLETTISYGPYKMTNFEDAKQVIYEQNENWYGYEKSGDYLVSYTEFTVDGKYLQQYITTKIVIDVMDESVMKQKFMKGELMSWSPDATELDDYKFSTRLQVVDETYTMSLFFHTKLENLQKLDNDGKNVNSVVLTNDTFRQAMSLAFDRKDFVTATQAWTPAFSLMNHLYHYDIYNDPESSYRKSEEAMKAIVNLYGVEYGEGKLYETLEEAHKSITGYNLTQAKALFTRACDELVAKGLYTKGEDIKIQIGWAKGALQASDNDQCALLQKHLNAALEGTGFGSITLEPLGNINNRYADTAAGTYAIGYGAWGGAAFYPFRNFQVYFDPDQYAINEAGCWDPTTTDLTLTVNGEDVTMTWQEWGNSMIGTGAFADADNKVKLYITAQLEEKFLAKFYRIPLAVTTVCSLNSYKIEDYTDQYNIMYGFGGFRIMDYNYTDAEWDAYVASQGGELNYK